MLNPAADGIVTGSSPGLLCTCVRTVTEARSARTMSTPWLGMRTVSRLPCTSVVIATAVLLFGFNRTTS